MPGPGVELIGEEEIAEVLEVLNSRYLSRYGPSDDPAFGAKCRRVEQEVAALAGVRYGLGLSGGGSSGLWLALLALGVGPGDEVIVPGFTFVASISAVVYARARPGPGGGRPDLQPGSGGRGSSHHTTDAGHHRRAHAGRAGAARRS